MGTLIADSPYIRNMEKYGYPEPPKQFTLCRRCGESIDNNGYEYNRLNMCKDCIKELIKINLTLMMAGMPKNDFRCFIEHLADDEDLDKIIDGYISNALTRLEE